MFRVAIVWISSAMTATRWLSSGPRSAAAVMSPKIASLATVAASVAAGRTVVPHLVDGVEPTADGVEPLTRAESRALRSMMEGVVSSGSGRVLSVLLPGVGAKTGTAEFGDTRPDGSLATHAWMIAFDGDLAVAVFVEKGASGSGVAGPVLLDFLRAG